MRQTVLYPGALAENVAYWREWNFPLFINAGFDLRGLELLAELIRPNGTRVTGGVALGSGEVHLPQQTLLEHCWAIYMVRQGDLSQVGTYTVQLDTTPSRPYGSPPFPQSTFQVIVHANR